MIDQMCTPYLRTTTDWNTAHHFTHTEVPRYLVGTHQAAIASCWLHHLYCLCCTVHVSVAPETLSQRIGLISKSGLSAGMPTEYSVLRTIAVRSMHNCDSRSCGTRDMSMGIKFNVTPDCLSRNCDENAVRKDRHRSRS